MKDLFIKWKRRVRPLILISTVVVLTGCGGSSSSSTGNEENPANDIAATIDLAGTVSLQDSPLPGHVGVSVQAEGNSTVVALVDGALVSDPQLVDISSRSDITDGDLSEALGQTFYRFDGTDGLKPIAYVLTPYEVLEIVECDPDEDYCSSPPFDVDANGYVSFYTRTGHYYGIAVDRGGS